MNDRAVSILEQYDLTVERTWKGRGSILFETKDSWSFSTLSLRICFIFTKYTLKFSIFNNY